tara:strand:- start:1305 stop:1799 length:495 start_codon:yes stop_codon:yes gene_type:complete
MEMILLMNVLIHASTNSIVHSIPITSAVIIMHKWSLEYKLNSIDMNEDKHFFERMTDDSLSGPFKINIEQEENKDIKNINNIISWVQVESYKSKKGVFVASIDGCESMLSFVENYDHHIVVCGFLSCPFIESDVHNAARSALALNLLDIASDVDKDILFKFRDY